MTFTLPVNEAERLNKLYSYNIIDKSLEKSFQSFTKIASMVCQIANSAISFIDKDKVLVKSAIGFHEKEVNREMAFCSNFSFDDDLFIISDTLAEPRFSENKFVISEPNVRFYAGVPLKSMEGYYIGTICVWDTKPNSLSQEQIDVLKFLSDQIMSLLESSKNNIKPEEKNSLTNVLLKNTDNAFWSVDRDYHLVSFNTVFQNDFETTFKFLPEIGMKLDKQFKSHEYKYWKELYNRAFAGEEIVSEYNEVLNEQEMHYEFSFYPTYSGTEITGAYILSKNIKKIKNNESMIIESENKFKSAFDNSSIGMAMIEMTGKCIKTNKSLSKILGYSEQEFLELKFQDLAYIEDKEIGVSYAYQMVNGEIESYQVEKRYIHKNGNIVYLALSVSLVYDNYEKPRYFLAQAQDITKSKAIEKQLLFQADILENVQDCIIVTDRTGNIIYWNEGATKIFGYSKEDVADKTTTILYPDDNKSNYEESLDNIVSGKHIKKDWKGKTKDGREIWIDLKTTPLQDKEGNITGFIGVSKDITHKKQIEHDLIKSKEIAENAAKVKSEFLATMSHEIRTPMNGVIGMTSLLMQTDMNNDQKEIVDVIRSSGDNLLNIINEILDFSKIESGKLEFENQTFDLKHAIDDVIDLLSPKAKDRSIDLISQINQNVPAFINSDITRLKQIIINLMDNAIKFTEQGQVMLLVDLIKQPSQGDMLKFSIKDTGIGMDTIAINKLFQPFSQADSSTTRKYGGTGLGLAISKRLVNLMNGNIWVESKQGEGTSFYFTIKITEKSPAIKTENIKNVDKIDIELAKKYPLNILLVEDNPVNQKLALKIFQKMGYLVDSVSNGLEALEILKQRSYNIIFMDVQMPEMDGIEATKYIVANYEKRPVIVALTANSMEGDKEICLSVGMDDYISKPFTSHQIQNSLIKWAEKVK